MAKRGSRPEKIPVTGPGDIPGPTLDPIVPTPVDVPKPPPPDVSVGFLEKVGVVVTGVLNELVRKISKGQDILPTIPTRGQITAALAVVGGVVLLVPIIILLIVKGC